MTQQRPDPKSIPIEELAKFNMFTPSPGMDKKMARLTFGIRDGNPRISVFLNNPQFEKGAGIINASFFPAEWFTLMDQVIAMYERGQASEKIEAKVFMNSKREDGSQGDKVLQGAVVFGYDNNGIACVALRANDRPTPVFRFTFTDYVHLLINGKQVEESELSRMMATAAMRGVREVFVNHIGYKKPPYQMTGGRQNDNGNTGGRQNNSRTNEFNFDDVA